MTKRFYVTTAIDYVNAPPHIGHALEKIQADVLARYHRFLKEDVFFLTGTDDNAQKNVQAADKQGLPIQEFTNRNAAVFKEMGKLLNVSNNDFIRTSSKSEHWPGVVKLWQECQKAGDIYQKEYSGLYCLGCEAFITEKDLENGLCPEHLKAPERVSEKNYFFRLSRYQDKLKRLIKSDKLRIVPEKRKNETLKFIESGLEDFSVSRPAERMKNWGIPVPGDNSQIIYVWYDALSNYITGLGYGRKDNKLFKRFWPADVHVIGKGILRFHAVFWPAMILSTGLELPRTIFVHDYITVGGQKMSKTIGNIINPIELVEKYGTDPVRYFFLREFSPFQDGDFSYKRLEDRYNSDLAKGLGNLTARILTMAQKTFTESVKYNPDSQFKSLFEKTTKQIGQHMQNFRFNDAVAAVWQLIGFCDRYIEKERPWEEGKEQALNNLLAALSHIALSLQPFLPGTSEKIFKQLGIKNKSKPLLFRVGKGESLFPRLEKE